ncbi:TauD/TfdA family dioxygenase [Kitasatospora sp. LaBMicrA B282]|uniref:TauD/TfdA family dioxygenase n=1 Tax=Kitasatospora sp. LaBMicrA B282 TaxID=3420949 RepID=UPI003D122AE0
MNSRAGQAWWGKELADEPEAWRIAVPPEVAAELLAAARAAVAAGRRPDLDAPRPTSLGASEAFAAELGGRLAGGPGFVVATGFPAAGLDPLEYEMAYWLLGLLLGRPVSQSGKRDLLGRVEDRGADISSPVQRGYESSAGLPFHVDRTDVIGLLCVRPAASGGLSRVASSRLVRDLLAAEWPDLLAELEQPLPHDRRGEEQPGEQPWSGIPVFSETGGDFATRYVRRFITGSQRHPGAPRLTERQIEAMDALDEILERPGLSLDMELREGDLQLLNNFHILHARTAFADGGGRGRLLLRLWLAFADSPELPEHYAALYGATAGGSYRGGVWPAGGAPAQLGRPVAALG